MAELKIVASIVAKDNAGSEILSALHNVADNSRQEMGCISYVVHQDVSDPLRFTILEIWKSQEAIDTHNNSPHFDAFKKAIDGKIDALEINILKEIY
ncbi:antibiotic biosynthesis monooxygenase [Bacteroidales bacterium]|nr:antibiotic biosynthesis monooxygenase [Bacteroidales bacterium]